MSSLYTTQALTIIIIFGFSFAMGTAIRNQIWEKESKNAQVRNVQTMYIAHIGTYEWMNEWNKSPKIQIRFYLSKIPTFNSHFLVRSGNYFLKNFPHFYLIKSGNLSENLSGN